MSSTRKCGAPPTSTGGSKYQQLAERLRLLEKTRRYFVIQFWCGSGHRWRSLDATYMGNPYRAVRYSTQFYLHWRFFNLIQWRAQEKPQWERSKAANGKSWKWEIRDILFVGVYTHSIPWKFPIIRTKTVLTARSWTSMSVPRWCFDFDLTWPMDLGVKICIQEALLNYKHACQKRRRDIQDK